MAGPLSQAAALQTLAAADFQHTRELRSIWRDPRDDIPELNGALVGLIGTELQVRTAEGTEGNPLGRIIIGQAGAGKTHLLGAVRRDVWRRGGWFVLLDLLDIGDFWATTALSFVDSLGRPMADGRSQGEALLARLLPPTGLRGRLMRRLRRGTGAAALLDHLRVTDRAAAQVHRDVVFAFAALQAADPDAQDYARAWLLGEDIGVAGRAALGVLMPALPPRRAVEGLSWLMARGGPTVLAIDQIDALISVAHAQDQGADAAPSRARTVLDEVAGGLMALRDTLHRSMTLLSTLEATWEVLSVRAVRSFAGRFHAPIRLPTLSSASLARRLVEARLARAAPAPGFSPPYPSWPFRAEAFATAVDFTPRQLLAACEAHRSACLLAGEVQELASFTGVVPDAPAYDTMTPGAAEDLDAQFAQLRAEAAVEALLAADAGEPIGDLLRAALAALLRESDLPASRSLTLQADLAGMHARLRLSDHVPGGQERSFCFCVLPQSNARAVQPRLRSAMTAAGIARALPANNLFIVRNSPWPSGPVTQELVAALHASGGRVLAVAAEDVRTFAALRELLARGAPDLDAWLRQRRPVAGSAFFQAAGVAAALAAAPQAPPPAAAPLPALATDAALPLGQRPGDGAPVLLPLRLLARHVAVIAGSGSGKTVFLRRLVEEAALLGVPAIVLDSNNDLVRLGMPWPEPPPGFTPADAAKAARLADTAEVVVWTPGRSRGNPLVLAPLPDFAAVRGDVDECEQAVGMAAESLQGLLPAGGAARLLRQGVLMDALRWFAAKGGGSLDALIELLRDLPPEATDIDRAAKLAGEIANALVAARARNPLLDGVGAAADPAELLGGRGRRTRISVISLSGLASEEARQDFVARLLMALFTHIRRHPASADRPVTGLLVMDEAQNFAPSVQASPSRAATLALARQARKYGLGMVFATQMPRAIDTGIIGNCTTQLFGRLNAPAAMETVRDVLASRGGAPEDLGRLAPGQFYLTTEGRERPQKLQAPLCLTWHAANPPAEEELVTIAAAQLIPRR